VYLLITKIDVTDLATQTAYTPEIFMINHNFSATAIYTVKMYQYDESVALCTYEATST